MHKQEKILFQKAKGELIMKKEKLKKVVRYFLVVAFGISIVGNIILLKKFSFSKPNVIETKSNSMETNSITIRIEGALKITKKIEKDFFDTMGAAVINSFEVVNENEDNALACAISNDGEELITADWFYWSEEKIGYMSYCPVELESNSMTVFYMDGKSRNSTYLIHAKYNGMDKYIAFRLKK